MSLHVRWLGSVRYQDALALQHGLFAEPDGGDHLLLLEHPHVYTLGVRADLANVLVPPASVGAELVRANRGGDVTYHGPGQLVGYPILSLPGKGGDGSSAQPAGRRGVGMADTVAYVTSIEQLLIDVLADLDLPTAGRLRGYPGVWLEPRSARPRKVAAVGVRVTRGRTMHGFALNVDPELSYFGHIVPCGIADKPVTSLRQEGIDVSMREVVDAVVARATERWAPRGDWDRADAVWRHRPDDLSPFTRGEGPGVLAGKLPAGLAMGAAGATGAAAASDGAADPVPATASGTDGTSVRLVGRLAEAGVAQGLAVGERKPEWMRAKVRLGEGPRRLKRTLRDLDLVTVCEEAGCPNLSECWSDGTATFMINGERCTRKCGFCLVDTRHPMALDADEPQRVAEAVARMGLAFAVVTAVARDDLADGGAAAFAETIRAIRTRNPGTQVEVLIPDCKGDPEALATMFEARPDVLNHNIETVLRLQRAVRPSAGYARSLSVLARAKAAGLTTKSGITVGMGETDDEVRQTLADLRGVGVDIVTIGQYLRPTSNHLPVQRWVTPDQFAAYADHGHALGIGHVESSPLTRSSYHAREAADGGAPAAFSTPAG